MPLRGSSVLITGAADGIGAATGRALAAAGASVVLVDVEGEKLHGLEEEIGSAAMAAEADVTDATAMARAVYAGIERFGGIDAVVAGAGIDAIGPAADMDDSTFTRVIEVNLLGTWRTIRASLRELRRRRGYLLIISSGSAVAQGPFEAPYNASKAGVAALANTLRLEERRHGVAVGVAYFGLIATQHGLDSIHHPLLAEVLGRVPRVLRAPTLRAAPVEDAAAAILRAIERRSHRLVYPPNQRLAVAFPGLTQALIDRTVRPG